MFKKEVIRFSLWQDYWSIPPESIKLYEQAGQAVTFLHPRIEIDQGFSQFQLDAAAFLFERITYSDTGGLVFVAGPMRSGKSAVLYRLALALKGANLSYAAFYHRFDSARNGGRHIIQTRGNGQSLPARPYQSFGEVSDILERMEARVGLVDEIQFAQDLDVGRLTQLKREMKREGQWAVVAGLDFDFRREPWESAQGLISYADTVVFLPAACEVSNCGELAFFTQRQVNGEPAYYCDPVVMVGAEEEYFPACAIHHQVQSGTRP